MLLQSNVTNTTTEKGCCLQCHGILVFDACMCEKICSKCGIIVKESDDFLETDNIETALADNDRMSEIAEPTSSMMYDISLPTFIDKKNVDASGKQINDYLQIERLRKLNMITMSNNYKGRNLNKAVKELRRITEILGITSSVAERASYIYRKALNKGLIRGRSITGIVAATIYVACKEMEIAFPIDRIEDLIDGISKKSVIYYYKFLLRQTRMNFGVPDPAQNVSRIAVRAGLSGKTERKALDVLEKVKGQAILSGKKPVSLAAAALYLAALQNKEYTTQLRIAVASELTTVTVRKRYLELAQILENSSKRY